MEKEWSFFPAKGAAKAATALESMPPLYLHGDALLQVELGAEVKEAFQTTGEAAALGQTGDVLKRIGTVKLVAGVGGKKIPTLRVAASSHPKEKTNFRRKARPLTNWARRKGRLL